MKKALFTLGTLAAVATPIAAVVSCGSTTQSIKSESEQRTHVETGTFVRHEQTLSGCHDVIEVAKYLNDRWELRDPSTFKLQNSSFQALTRIGTNAQKGVDEIAEFNLLKGDTWVNEYEALKAAGQITKTTFKDMRDEYIGNTKGYVRFEPDFEVFANIYPEFKSDFDYSNGGKLKFELAIKDREANGQKLDNAVAYWTPLKTSNNETSVDITADQLQNVFSKGYNVAAPTTPEQVTAAKNAIKNLSNAYKLIEASTNKEAAKSNLKLLSEYFDKSTMDFFKVTLQNEKVQEFINNNIDKIYDAFVKYPATDATVLPAMEQVLKAPSDDVKFMIYLMADEKPEKRNLILGLKLLQFMVEEANQKEHLYS